MKEHQHREALEKILDHDKRYARCAYAFVQEAVVFAAKKMQAETDAAELETRAAPRHISGGELLEAMRELALQQYGPLAYDVLTDWGVMRCQDFGTIVFNLVEHGLLGASEEDSIEDFVGGYDLRDAFLGPYAAAQEDRPPPAPIY